MVRLVCCGFCLVGGLRLVLRKVRMVFSKRNVLVIGELDFALFGRIFGQRHLYN